MMRHQSVFVDGLRDGVPIALGYFSVSFSIGILARAAGLTAAEGFLSSIFTRASAGEYGGYTLIAAGAGVMELVALCVVANLRYLLMVASLSQKFHPAEPLWKRVMAACCITDEIFGISIARSGYLSVNYPLGATLVAGSFWGAGTACGIVMGNLLPVSVVSALSVALYGMFIAVIIPPCKQDKALGMAVACSFVASGLCVVLPWVSRMNAGVRIVVLTVAIAAVMAWLKPVHDESL